MCKGEAAGYTCLMCSLRYLVGYCEILEAGLDGQIFLIVLLPV